MRGEESVNKMGREQTGRWRRDEPFQEPGSPANIRAAIDLAKNSLKGEEKMR